MLIYIEDKKEGAAVGEPNEGVASFERHLQVNYSTYSSITFALIESSQSTPS